MAIKNKISEPSDKILTKYPVGWALNTIKFTFNYYDMFSTELFGMNKNLKMKEQIKLNDYCSKAHLNYRKYLLLYTVYVFGSVYAQYDYNKIKLKFDEEFLIKTLRTFFKLSNYLNYNPTVSGQYLDFLDSLPLKKKVNLNKNFYSAHALNLKEDQIKKIVKWFLENWQTNNAIQKVFYGSAHYIGLEHHPLHHDKDFKKSMSEIDGENIDEMINNILVVMAKTLPTKFDKFKKSGLNKDIPLRLSYWYLATRYTEEINQSYLSSKYKEKLISNIIKKGSDLVPFGLKTFHKKSF